MANNKETGATQNMEQTTSTETTEATVGLSEPTSTEINGDTENTVKVSEPAEPTSTEITETIEATEATQTIEAVETTEATGTIETIEATMKVSEPATETTEATESTGAIEATMKVSEPVTEATEAVEDTEDKVKVSEPAEPTSTEITETASIAETTEASEATETIGTVQATEATEASIEDSDPITIEPKPKKNLTSKEKSSIKKHMKILEKKLAPSPRPKHSLNFHVENTHSIRTLTQLFSHSPKVKVRVMKDEEVQEKLLNDFNGDVFEAMKKQQIEKETKKKEREENKAELKRLAGLLFKGDEKTEEIQREQDQENVGAIDEIAEEAPIEAVLEQFSTVLQSIDNDTIKSQIVKQQGVQILPMLFNETTPIYYILTHREVTSDKDLMQKFKKSLKRHFVHYKTAQINNGFFSRDEVNQCFSAKFSIWSQWSSKGWKCFHLGEEQQENDVVVFFPASVDYLSLNLQLIFAKTWSLLRRKKITKSNILSDFNVAFESSDPSNHERSSAPVHTAFKYLYSNENEEQEDICVQWRAHQLKLLKHKIEKGHKNPGDELREIYRQLGCQISVDLPVLSGVSTGTSFKTAQSELSSAASKSKLKLKSSFSSLRIEPSIKAYTMTTTSLVSSIMNPEPRRITEISLINGKHMPAVLFKPPSLKNFYSQYQQRLSVSSGQTRTNTKVNEVSPISTTTSSISNCLSFQKSQSKISQSTVASATPASSMLKISPARTPPTTASTPPPAEPSSTASNKGQVPTIDVAAGTIKKAAGLDTLQMIAFDEDSDVDDVFLNIDEELLKQRSGIVVGS